MASILGTFRFKSDEPSYDFEAMLTTMPVPVAGYGGWQKVPRPRRKALTEWVGRDSTSIEIEFMIDSFSDGTGYDNKQAVDTLEKLAGIGIHDPEPPLFKYTTNPPALGWHNNHHASHVLWYVDTLRWEKDQILPNQSGNPMRAAGTVIITQHVKDEHLEALSAVEARRQSSTRGRGGSTRYTVRRGDTLSKIAAKKLGRASRWREIAKLNNIRDPKNLKVGRKIRIPAR